jgi:hypothetical protein
MHTMQISRHRLAAAALLLLQCLLSGPAALAADAAPAPTPAAAPAIALSPYFGEPAHKTTYAMVSVKLLLPEMVTKATPLIMKLYQDNAAAKVEVIGPLVLFYNGFSDAKTPFVLEIGLPVDPATGLAPATPNYSVVVIHHQQALCVDYRGAVSALGTAWDGLMHEADTRSLQLGTRTSEEYFCWINAASPHNIIRLSAELRGDGPPDPVLQPGATPPPPAKKPEF